MNKKKKQIKTRENPKNPFREGFEEEKTTNEHKKLQEDQLRVEDLQHAERVKINQKIDGIERIKRQAQRAPKKAISKFDRKTFDPGFMPLHTSEITYALLQKELQQTGLITDLVAEVNAGKEASIYIAHLQGAPLILKAFRHQQTCHNRSKGNPQLRAAAIAAREYYHLTRAYKAGVRVPTPARQINNVILMRFIGSGWEPAPQLRKATLEDPLAVLDELIEQVKIMYTDAKLIHGDLSEYNILIHNQQPVLIDFPQAIDMSLYHMQFTSNKKQSMKILQKDLHTLLNYFEKEYSLTCDIGEILYYIIGKDQVIGELQYHNLTS
ncbi:MAG: RIO1 family regulatory kinase/ATPase [Asgard group archaeon]|nr:RIO1 family regulatory kinase/ATPase [Asgard group archaeon]